MLKRATLEALAAELEDAQAARVQISQFSHRYPQMDIEAAYGVQRAWMDLKRRQGRHAIGHKIGLTSRAMQRSVNITEPDYGLLLDDMLFEPDSLIPFERFIEPRVEVELAFVLRRRIEGETTIEEVLAATDYVTPAVEIIDARIQRIDPASGRTRTVIDTISDNAANAGIVLGGERVKPGAIDLRWAGAILTRNEVVEDTGVAAAVLNHPANGVVWLARRLAAYGECLEAGEVVLAGSFTAPYHAARGDSFVVDYGRLGTISMAFQ